MGRPFFLSGDIAMTAFTAPFAHPVSQHEARINWMAREYFDLLPDFITLDEYHDAVAAMRSMSAAQVSEHYGYMKETRAA